MFCVAEVASRARPQLATHLHTHTGEDSTLRIGRTVVAPGQSQDLVEDSIALSSFLFPFCPSLPPPGPIVPLPKGVCSTNATLPRLSSFPSHSPGGGGSSMMVTKALLVLDMSTTSKTVDPSTDDTQATMSTMSPIIRHHSTRTCYLYPQPLDNIL